MIKGRVIGKMFMIIALLILALIVMLPFVWMILTSLKTYKETIKIPMVWLPGSWYWGNYEEVFRKMNFMNYYINTALVTVGITIPQLFFSALAAYAFARLNFPGKNFIFLTLMAALMIPLQMVLLPRFLILAKLKWVNTFQGVIIPEIASIYGTFFIRQQFMTLPKELDESAELDGCSYPRLFWSILLPLCSSTLNAMGILVVVFAWNNFLWPLIVLSDPSKFVLSIAIANLQGQYSTRYNLLTTASVLGTLPILLVFVLGQRYFLEGISTSGMKL
jgi:multiple sugar transport system permease protein